MRVFFWNQLGWVGRCQLGAYVISGPEWAGEKAQPAMSGLDYRYFLLCFRPFPPPAGVGERREEVVMLRGPADAAESSLRHTALPLPTSDHLVTVGALPPAPDSVHLSGGCGKVKGSLMCLGHGGKPQSLARPSFKPQFFPTSPKPSSAAWGDVTLAATFFF